MEVLCRTDHITQIEFATVQLPEEVFQVNYSDDVVQGVSLSYRVNLVQVLAYDVIQLLVVHVYVNGYDVAAIGHDGVDATVAQGEDAVHNILFTSCTSPFSVPSSIMDLISSSVTFSSAVLICSRLKISEVLLASIHTKGEAMTDSQYMGRANSLAARVEALMPMRLGTSSPKIIVR